MALYGRHKCRATVAANAVVVPNKMEPPIALPEFSSKDLNKTASGTSLGDTPELMQFFTQGGK